AKTATPIGSGSCATMNRASVGICIRHGLALLFESDGFRDVVQQHILALSEDVRRQLSAHDGAHLGPLCIRRLQPDPHGGAPAPRRESSGGEHVAVRAMFLDGVGVVPAKGSARRLPGLIHPDVEDADLALMRLVRAQHVLALAGTPTGSKRQSSQKEAGYR